MDIAFQILRYGMKRGFSEALSSPSVIRAGLSSFSIFDPEKGKNTIWLSKKWNFQVGCVLFFRENEDSFCTSLLLSLPLLLLQSEGRKGEENVGQANVLHTKRREEGRAEGRRRLE